VHNALLAVAMLLMADAEALPGDRSRPIVIRTQEAIRDEVNSSTTYRGDVELVQGSLRILADEIVVVSDQQEPLQVTARGEPARVHEQLSPDRPPLHAVAREVVYERGPGLLQLSGDCRVEQGDSSLDSERLDINLNARLLTAFAEPGSRARVRSVIGPERLREAQN
jgi:lipopolysaccharide export system protein LptA